jgi:hypothetical protein
MIGEARPDNKKRGKRTYFYNINHLDNTRWLSAPYSAFFHAWNQPNTYEDKVKILLELASKGYLLLDLFPFAINFQTIRLRFEYLPFWNQLINKICDLTNFGLLADKIFTAFTGPAALHHRIVSDIINGVVQGPVCVNCIINLAPNELYDLNNNLIPINNQQAYIRQWINLPNVLCHMNDLRHHCNVNSNGNFSSPIYQCECWDSSFQGPNSLFIRIAFGLQ